MTDEPRDMTEETRNTEAEFDESGETQGGEMDTEFLGARELSEGEIITAKVVQVQDEQAFVDIGWKSDLPIAREELSLTPVQSAREAVNVGDEIQVMVVKADDDEGPVLSHKRAAVESRWDELQEKLEKGERVSGRVVERNKGGLVVDIGVRGFVPASQATMGFVEDLNSCVGETWEMRLLELDRADNRVVLSRRAVLEEEREKARSKAMSKLNEGDVVDGRVARLTSFGAFVELAEGIEGLLHVSEIAWERVRDPSERLSQDQQIKVQIIKLDRDSGRISLSLRQLHPHPWTGIAERFPEGTVITGRVVRLAPFGAFVRLAEGVDGLVHISQMADRRVSRPEEVASVGQDITVKVIKVDEGGKRISLSMQQAVEEAEEEQVKNYLRGQGESMTTIGDLIRRKQEEKGEKASLDFGFTAETLESGAGKAAGQKTKSDAKRPAGKKPAKKAEETQEPMEAGSEPETEGVEQKAKTPRKRTPKVKVPKEDSGEGTDNQETKKDVEEKTDA